MEILVHVLILFLGIYFLVGFLFAWPFVFKGVQKIDPAASGSRWRFRLIIFPGVCAFWPLLLRRWVKGVGAPPVEINEHRLRAREKEAGA